MRQMRKFFQDSFGLAMRNWRIAGIVYFIQLCLALTLGMQVYSVLESSIGHSLEVNKLLHGYDHTVITDFLKVHGASITPLLGQLRWLLLVWLLFSVFLDAGLLYSIAPVSDSSKSTVQKFWLGGARYFFPFLKIGLSFLGLALFWTLLILAPIALFFEASLQYFNAETYSVWLAISLLVLYLLGLILLFVWSVLSRFSKINAGTTLWESIRVGARLLRSHFVPLLGFMFGLVVFQITLVVIYWFIESYSVNNSPILILLFFIGQQAFMFFRGQIRLMMYAGIGLVTKQI